MRLDRLISDTTGESRSQVRNFIKNGLAEVNGCICTDPGFRVDPENDRVSLNRRTITYCEHLYYMLNKPAGVLSATSDAGQRTVMDLFPKNLRKRLFPVGRLDKDTVGLLLITDDGELSHHLLSPRHHVEKTYLVHTEQPMTQEDAAAFEAGVSLDDGTKLMDARLNIDGDDPRRSLITIREGKYHQIKRMIASRSNRVIYLKRISMGSLTLDESLMEGEYRALSADEIDDLRKT